MEVSDTTSPVFAVPPAAAHESSKKRVSLDMC